MRFLLPIFLFFASLANAQSFYKTGDDVPDLQISKVLNSVTANTNLKKLQSEVTIIDFFGTWCAPCIKALPELANFTTKFKNDISVLLVSTEAESKLAKFIASHQPFAFPLIVDEDNSFTKAFQPPSYPYTVVLDKNLKVISITNAADLTEAMIGRFIEAGKNVNKIATEVATEIKAQTKSAPTMMYNESNNALVKLSQEFMYAAKTNENVDDYIKRLKDLEYNKIISDLKNDDDKKAFWINLYNAYTNASLHKNPEQYKSRNKFFKAHNIIVAGKTFSLDDIEHDILRRSKIKWSLGYLSKLFPGKIEKDLRVNKLDYRIHFALNCGAKSCPPIAFYNPESINTQLDVATTAFLTAEAEYNKKTNILMLPALLSWFRRDFGGKKKIIELLISKQILAKDVNPSIQFKKYDWTLYLNNYKS